MPTPTEEIMESMQRTATSDARKLWPDGIIPYTTDHALGSRGNLALIRRVMGQIEKTTCIRFVPRENQTDYIHLKYHEGCYSYLGRYGGEQPLSLGDGCLYNATVAHELLHAVGFYHEHTRPDRDNYVDIFERNIMRQFLRNFMKVDPNQIRLLTAFDYDSVMLYGSQSFSISYDKPSMLKKNMSRLREIYEKPGLSKSDITRVNKLYNCTV